MGTLASAIAALENVDPKYNNPGAISGTGDTGTSFGAGIGVYSTPSAGLTAFQNQLSAIYNGTSSYYNTDMTLDQFGQVYAPNQNYGSSVASILGVPSSTPLSSIPSGVGTSTANPLGSAGAVENPSFSQMTGGLTGSTTPASSPLAFVKNLFSANNLENLIFIVIGLLLLAAGIFSFKNSQTVIQTVGKAAKFAGKSSEVLAA